MSKSDITHHFYFNIKLNCPINMTEHSVHIYLLLFIFYKNSPTIINTSYLSVLDMAINIREIKPYTAFSRKLEK